MTDQAKEGETAAPDVSSESTDTEARDALMRAFANRAPVEEKKKTPGQPGHKLQAKWDEMYKRLQVFREKNGHCLVPNRYVEDPQLGSWVSTQRRHYKILTSGSGESTPMTPSRAQKLVDIGFVWSTKDPRHVPWEQRFSELVAFREKYGHSQVPIGWEENVQLSNWVSTQRQEYKLIQRGRQSRLTDDKIEKLNKLNFVWEAQRGGPRRKRKATVAVPPKANPVDISRMRAKASARAEKLKMMNSGSSPSLGPYPGDATFLQPATGMIPIVGPHVAALSAANPGLLPGIFPGALPGSAVPVAMPIAPQQWQLLANGAFQQRGPDGNGAAGGSSGGPTLFPMAAQLPMLPAGFQFSAHPSIIQNQMAAIQEQHAALLNGAPAGSVAVEGDRPQKMQKVSGEEDGIPQFPMNGVDGSGPVENNMAMGLAMMANSQMIQNPDDQKLPPTGVNDKDDVNDIFYDAAS